MRKELHYRYLSEVSIVYVAEKEIEALESSHNFISLRKCLSSPSVMKRLRCYTNISTSLDQRS